MKRIAPLLLYLLWAAPVWAQTIDERNDECLKSRAQIVCAIDLLPADIQKLLQIETAAVRGRIGPRVNTRDPLDVLALVPAAFSVLSIQVKRLIGSARDVNDSKALEASANGASDFAKISEALSTLTTRSGKLQRDIRASTEPIPEMVAKTQQELTEIITEGGRIQIAYRQALLHQAIFNAGTDCKDSADCAEYLSGLIGTANMRWGSDFTETANTLHEIVVSGLLDLAERLEKK